MICVSRAPLDKLLAYRKRMGWSFTWASSFGSDFNADFGVSAVEPPPGGPGVHDEFSCGPNQRLQHRDHQGVPGERRARRRDVEGTTLILIHIGTRSGGERVTPVACSPGERAGSRSGPPTADRHSPELVPQPQGPPPDHRRGRHPDVHRTGGRIRRYRPRRVVAQAGHGVSGPRQAPGQDHAADSGVRLTCGAAMREASCLEDSYAARSHLYGVLPPGRLNTSSGHLAGRQAPVSSR